MKGKSNSAICMKATNLRSILCPKNWKVKYRFIYLILSVCWYITFFIQIDHSSSLLIIQINVAHLAVSVSDVAYSLMYKIVIDDCVMISGSYILLSIVTYTQLIPPSSSPFTRNPPPPPPPGTSGGASIMTGVDNYLLSRAVRLWHCVYYFVSTDTGTMGSDTLSVSPAHCWLYTDTDTTNTNSFIFNISQIPPQ